MPRPKEEVMDYADDEFLTWLEDHLNYIEAYTYRMKMMMTVYREIKDEFREGFGWIPTRDFISTVNRLKKNLDTLFFEILTHQKSIISALMMWRETKSSKKKSKKTEKKKQDVDPSIM